MRLNIKDLKFSYNGKPVLKNIHMELSPGKVTALIGPNGTGKSTLLRCILGEKPDGIVLLGGKEVRAYKRNDIARIVSYLPQDGPAGNVLTVLEVVLLGRVQSLSWRISENDLQIAWAILEELGIDEFAARYIDQMSGGEKQMVFIAQALVQEPKILLLDEPISNLDLQHQLELLELIRELTVKRKIATLIALHDLNLAARYADELVALSNGEVYVSGKPAYVLIPEMLRKVYGVIARVDLNEDGTPVITPLHSIRSRSSA